MGAIEADTAGTFTAELQGKMPLDKTAHYDLVLENDLAGRAALAILWTRRTQLTIHVITDEPTPQHVLAFKSALESVRNAPSVQLIDPHRAVQLAVTSEHLIWAVEADRTENHRHVTLSERLPEHTLTPFLTGFDALDDLHPDQRRPFHEFVLREVIQEHARFLNFFGDRFNPQDLYERFKYPEWFTPAEGFSAALPQLWCHTVDADGTELARQPFSGTLQYEPQKTAASTWVRVDFGPVLTMLDAGADLTLSLSTSAAASPEGMRIQVLRDHTIEYDSKNVTGRLPRDLRLRDIQPDSTLTVALSPDQEHSESEPGAIHIRLTVHPHGTHPAPSIFSRLRTWFTDRASHRQHERRTI